MESPFFIVGAPRSGTTLLRLMLNRHSRLCVPPESHFIVELYEKLGENVSRRQFWAALSLHPRFLEWKLDAAAVRRKLDGVRCDWRSLWEVVFREYAQTKGKLRWGDKTPDYVEHLDLLHGIFPDAQMIHIVRDGRDVACSLKETPWYNGSLMEIASLWRRTVTEGRVQGCVLGKEGYFEVLYRDLVREPERNLRAICRFLGERFEPDMLSYHRDAEQEIPRHRQAWHARTKQPVSTKRIGRWRSELSATEVEQFESHCGQLLAELGCELQNKQHAAVGLRRSKARWSFSGRLCRG
ncbi:MAG TPA: sulfotransferase [Verrucomicrobiae bacterium]|nr:sulfotransferase [Verrucomicrobiae bacterium]